MCIRDRGNGGDHRDILVGNGVVNDRRIDFYDIAHQTVLLAVDDPALGLEHIAVQPAQTNGAASKMCIRDRDSGLTLRAVADHLSAMEPASLKICALLDKPARREAEIEADYVGFTIPNEFVVGYGLDYNEKYRNLPFIGVLKPEVYGA